MSVNLIDRRGIVAVLATNTGMGDLYDWLRSNGGPLAEGFVDRGYIAYPRRMARAVRRRLDKKEPKDKVLKASLRRFVGLLETCVGFGAVEV